MARIVSPVYRVGLHDIVVVETSHGRQAFYRSTGFNSKQRGKWFPFDEFVGSWLNKWAYTEGPGLEKGARLHRLGIAEFARISIELGNMRLPAGQQVPTSPKETAERTMNRILDFFHARRTAKMLARPVPE